MHVPVVTEEFGGDIQVTDGCLGVDAGRGAADNRLEDFGFHVAKLDATTCPVVFRPRRPAFHV